MKISTTKILIISIAIGMLALGAMAFTPLTGTVLAAAQTEPGDDETPGDSPHQALADALEVTVEELQAAYKAAAQQAMEQSVKDALEKGLITQERADALMDGEGRLGRHGGAGFGLHGNLDELVAAELGIPVEEFQAAQDAIFTDRIEQALADGKLTQTAADLILARRAADSYFEEAWTSAYQNAVGNALADGAIDQSQADLLLDNVEGGFPGGFGGRMPFGGRGGHLHR